MTRRTLLTLIGAMAIACTTRSPAQQPLPGPPKRLGLLSPTACPLPPDNPFSRRLAELGWRIGKDYDVDCVSTVDRLDRLPELVRELASRRPDVLVAYPSLFIRALQQGTSTIPIVMLATADPVRNGFVTNLARPEGNVTGVAWFGYDIIPKRIELLKEIVPNLRRLAVIAGGSGDAKLIEIIEENVALAARMLGITWQRFPAVPGNYDDVFARIAAAHFDAAYVQSGALVNQPENRLHIGRLALRHRIPTVAEGPEFARDGLLLAYSQDFNRSLAHAAEYVDKILSGRKPRDLPVEQATELHLVINLRTAKSLALTVPPSLIARADDVIE
jgi:putative ABC transport system substrate-binding protein